MSLKIRIGNSTGGLNWGSLYMLLLAASIIISMTQISSQVASVFSYAAIACGLLMMISSRGSSRTCIMNRKLQSRFIFCFVLLIIYAITSYYIVGSSIDITSYGRLKSLITITLHCIIGSVALPLYINFRMVYKFLYVIGIGCLIVFLTYYGASNILIAITLGKRLGADILAINLTGMSFAMFSIFYFYMMLRLKKYKVVNVVLFIISVVICASTGSRGAMLSIILGILILLFFIKSEHKWKMIFATLIGVAVLLIVLNGLGINTFIFDRLSTLWSGSNAAVTQSDEGRWRMITTGFEMWKKKPIFGYGFNMYSAKAGLGGYYSHNNFIQILSELGIVGVILYYFPRLSLVFVTLKKGKTNNEIGYTLLFTLNVMMLFCDMSIVSYYNLILNFVYVLICAAVFSPEQLDGYEGAEYEK